MRQKAKVVTNDAPAGGWGSLKAVASILTQEEVAILGSEILLKQNKPDGFMCVSCSWAKPAKPRTFEFCENGAKATAWEITSKTVTPEFFAQHTLAELRSWSDHQLEEQGRLTTPMRYDRASDKYLPVDWDEAFRIIGAELNRSPFGRDVHVRTCLARNQLHVPIVRPHVRHQQFPRQLEHVPRDDVGGAAGGDRSAGRHGAAGGFRWYSSLVTRFRSSISGTSFCNAFAVARKLLLGLDKGRGPFPTRQVSGSCVCKD
jgi:anaerobic selenocysteine-containing dehydrogenase